jgi:hypothetical protein
MAYVVLIHIVTIHKGWEAMDVINITYSIRMHVLMVSLFCEKVGGSRIVSKHSKDELQNLDG